ncbi:MAG: hypothetical protein JSU73_04855 [candidate division WOR-3 bacterium]|nr:MAG: hypothetical protein JSU73_04855 [candidate division WOR-3 bacterium]
MKRLLVLLLLLPAALLYGQHPFPADTSFVPVPLRGFHSSPSAARGASNCLVAWESENTLLAARVSPDRHIVDVGPLELGEGNAPAVAACDSLYLVASTYHDNVRAARITAGGELLDSVPFAVSHGTGTAPAVGYSGSVFLVAWSDDDIRAARVMPDGTVLDTVDIVISAAADRQDFPDVSFDGTNWLVVWQDMRAGGYYDIYCARVTPAGEVLDPSGIAVSTAQYSQWYPAAGFDGTNHLIAWQDYRTTDFDVYAARVTPAGTVLDPDGITVADRAMYHRFPSVAFDGTNWLVAWERCSDGYDGIWATRVTTGGAVLDPEAIMVCPNGSSYNATVYDGADWLIVWQDTALFGTWLSPDGQVINPTPAAVAAELSDQKRPAAAWNGRHWLVTWFDEHYSLQDICAVLLDSSGTPHTSRLNLRADPWQSVAPDLDACGDRFLVVWEDDRQDDRQIWAARVEPDGTVLDSVGFPVTADTLGHQSPRVCSGDNQWLAVWNAPDLDGSVYGARVTPDGAVLDPQGIRINLGSEDRTLLPAIGSDGTDYLVAWIEARRVVCARVDRGGTVLDPVPIYLDSQTVAGGVAVLHNGRDYVVLWLSRSADTILGAIVSSEGIVLDPDWLALVDPDRRRYSLAAAVAGPDIILAWQQQGYGLCFARVDSSGTVTEQSRLVQTSTSDIAPHASPGPGDMVLLTWSTLTDSLLGRSCGVSRVWGLLPPYLGVSERLDRLLVRAGRLQARPNPFRTRLEVRPVPANGFTVHDRSGRLVARCTGGQWDGRDQRGHEVEAGVYFIRAAGRAPLSVIRTR